MRRDPCGERPKKGKNAMNRLKRALLCLLAAVMLLSACTKDAPTKDPETETDAPTPPACTTLRIVMPHNSDTQMQDLAARLH